jgi:hypothetical protein
MVALFVADTSNRIGPINFSYKYSPALEVEDTYSTVQPQHDKHEEEEH